MKYTLVKIPDSLGYAYDAYFYNGRYYDKDLVDLCTMNCFGKKRRSIESVLKEMDRAK